MKKTEESDYIKALRSNAKDPANMIEIERDGDLKKKSSKQEDDRMREDHFRAMRERMAENQEVDAQVAKQRIKEKRQKVKKRLRREAGLDDSDQDDDGAGGVVLGSPNASGSASASDQSGNSSD